MSVRPPRSSRTYTRFPYTPLFRAVVVVRPDDDRHPVRTQVGDPLPRPGRGLADAAVVVGGGRVVVARQRRRDKSEEHTSELQSLMRISYAVFCLKKKNRIRSNR